MYNSTSRKAEYWFQDLNKITDIDSLEKFYPTKGMSRAEKVNSLVRLSIVVGIVLSIYNRNSNWLIIPVTFMTITWVLYLFRVDQARKEVKKYDINGDGSSPEIPEHIRDEFNCVLQKDHCATVTNENPFMNPIPFDNRKRPPACDVLNKNVQAKINNSYGRGVFHDSSDIFRGSSGLRQFYTTPSTTYPSNRDSFATWLYGTPPTCKEGNEAQCSANLYHPPQRKLFAPGHGSTTN